MGRSVPEVERDTRTFAFDLDAFELADGRLRRDADGLPPFCLPAHDPIGALAAVRSREQQSLYRNESAEVLERASGHDRHETEQVLEIAEHVRGSRHEARVRGTRNDRRQRPVEIHEDARPGRVELQSGEGVSWVQ